MNRAAKQITRVIESSERSRFSKPLTLAAMSLGFGVVQLDVTIVNTALNSIGISLGGGVSQLQWVVSAYTIAFAALILTAGALGDRLGAKRIFMAGFGVFTVASVGCALAPTSLMLIAARAVQGVGAAILVPNSLSLLNHAYPEETERGRAVGLWLAGASVALTAGPPVGGVLIALIGWRSIFLVNLPIGLAGLWLTWRYAIDTPRADRKLDLPGQVAAISALGMLAAALIEGGPPWLEQPLGNRGIRHRRDPDGAVHHPRTLCPTANAAAFAFQAPRLCADNVDRSRGQYPVLRVDLRLQPVLSKDQRLIAA
jgi:MFS transporter, DHA2 family, methylenomycin A resistance protein